MTSASPLLAVEDEALPVLHVAAPLADALAQGRVFIRYWTENLRILPVFGTGALNVSPRVGHVHVTVDEAPWHFIDASGETIVVVGLAPGPHRVTVDLADPVHRRIDRKTVDFIVPEVHS